MRLAPHHVGIIVSDLARSTAFYAALGFEPVEEREMADKTLSFMRLGCLQIELFDYREKPPAAVRPDRAPGFRHLAFETDDIDDAYARLRAAGIIGDDIAIRELPGGWRLLFFDDPDGMEIEIKQA